MTRIDRPGIGPAETAQAAATQRTRDERGDWLSGGRPGDTGGGLGRDARFGQHGLGAEFSDPRENAFLDKMRHALGNAADASIGEEDRAKLRLLAVAGEVPQPAAPALPLPVGGGPAAAPGRAEWVGALVARIEQALHAQPLDASRAGISLSLDQAGESGIAGLTITMSQTEIDVVLTRTGGEATAAWLAAAQALADRLQARFPQRIVRVHETEGAGQPETPAEGLDAISRLLGRSGERS